MELLVYYMLIGLIIFLCFGFKSENWRRAAWTALLWPIWVGYLLISLFWGIGSKL